MKTMMPLLLRRTACCSAIVFLAAFGSGCVTEAFNKHTSGGRWHPGKPEQIWAFTTTNPAPQLAVAFHQYFVGERKIPDRPALWCPGQSNCTVFVDAAKISQFTNTWIQAVTIPVYYSADEASPDPAARPPRYALLAGMNSQFTLHAPDFSPGPYTLPVTIQKPLTALRLIGTPVALAADAAIVAGAVMGPVLAPFEDIPSFK